MSYPIVVFCHTSDSYLAASAFQRRVAWDINLFIFTFEQIVSCCSSASKLDLGGITLFVIDWFTYASVIEIHKIFNFWTDSKAWEVLKLCRILLRNFMLCLLEKWNNNLVDVFVIEWMLWLELIPTIIDQQSLELS